MPSTEDRNREWIAAEVRAELARQRKVARDVGEILGVSKQAAHTRLTGKQPFRVEELTKLAAALGVPVTRFLPPEPALVPPSDPPAAGNLA